jgi:CheY-like chemotaxis protein
MKHHPVGSLIRLVVLTSLIQRGHAELARQAGFLAYLTKPVRHDQLANCLRTVLGMPELMIGDRAVIPATVPAVAPQLITRHTLTETKPAARILVAEDNLINQKLTVRMLEKLGYQSDIAENGQEALAALAKGSYAVILMDCQMPLVDGFEATRLIRQKEAAVQESAADNHTGTLHIPIIAVTANAMAGDRERCLAAGMDDYLTKPLRKEDLRTTLDRWIPVSIQLQVEQAVDAGHNEEEKSSRYLPVIFDTAAMLRNIGGDAALMEDLVALFLQRYQTLLEGIRIALADGDRRAVEQAAHLLKGTAGNLCASEVVLSAGQLEALGRLGTLVEGPIIYVQIEKAVLRLVQLLEERCRTHTESQKHAA